MSSISLPYDKGLEKLQLVDGDGFNDDLLPSRLQKLNLRDEVAAGSDSEDEDVSNSIEFCEFHGVRQFKYPNAPPNAPTRIRLKEHTVYNIPKKDCVKCKEEKLAKKKRKKSKEPNIVTMYKNGHPRIAPLHEDSKYQFLVYY
ncbi:hypothetical protein RchiOBHm_Chr2g0162251 [Rosa chinensis]|uniref:Uncharacterized protein n=1 Tax=Rosa chinensis TaxID=74649 RepID=A0A2P6S315_ROSCH|nr:hypothetical protein RchiOBHm_Chr2g0162251 [Rosa chinensis]